MPFAWHMTLLLLNCPFVQPEIKFKTYFTQISNRKKQSSNINAMLV